MDEKDQKLLDEAIRQASALALSLDNETHTPEQIKEFAEFLLPLPIEFTLFTVKKFIGIGRLVMYDMDQYPEFSKCLMKVNSLAMKLYPIHEDSFPNSLLDKDDSLFHFWRLIRTAYELGKSEGQLNGNPLPPLP